MKKTILSAVFMLFAFATAASAYQACCDGGPCCDGAPCCDE